MRNYLLSTILFLCLSFSVGTSHAITYAKWSTTDIYQLSVVASSSDLLVSQLFNGTWGTVRSDISVSSGKWYWEYEMIYHGTTGATEYAIMGVANATADITIPLGTDNYGFGYFASTGDVYRNSGLTSCGSVISGYNHDILGVALDVDSGTVDYYVNGVFKCSVTSLPSGPIFASVAVGSQYEGLRANFGASAFSYTPPSGYNSGLYSGSSGGGGGSSTSTAPYLTNIPASLYASNVLLADVNSSSTYTYISSNASSTLKQVGLVYITHLTTDTPVITWNSSAMTFLQSASSFDTSTYTTSLYYIKYPVASSTISITGISSSSIKFLSTSVWSNADASAVFDKYNSFYFSNKAYVDLPNTVSIASTNVGVFFGSPSDKLRVSTTNVLSTASSTYQFSFLSAPCYNTIECPIGYTFNNTISLYNYGVSLAINLYATSTLSFDPSISTSTEVVSFLSSSTVAISSDSFASLTGAVSFSDCFSGIFPSIASGSFWFEFGNSFTCSGKVMVLWVFSLFFPTPDQVFALDNYFISSLNNGKLTTSFFLFFNHLKALSLMKATTTADFYAITVPTSISGGSYATTSFPISVSSAYHLPTNVDTMFAGWISTFFAVFGFFIFAMFMLRLLV